MPVDRRSSKDIFFATFSLAAVVWLVVVCPWWFVWDEPQAAWSALIVATVILLNFAAWTSGLPLVGAHAIFQASLLLWTVFNALHMGGIASPVMVWLGVLPILPFYVLSRQWGYFCLSIAVIVVLTMFFAQTGGLIETGKIVSPGLWAITIGSMAVAQAMVAMALGSAQSEHLLIIQRKSEQLENMKHRLTSSHAAKDKFLATVSRELRTPLNVIMGYLNLLHSHRQLPAQVLQQIQHALNSSSIMLNVVNDLLDFSQIQHGQLAFAAQKVELKKVIFEAHAALAAKASEQKLFYAMALGDQLPNWAHLDPHRLTQIIFNLLSNAIQFTPKGFVELRVDYMPLTDAKGNLHLRVTDSGVGIPLTSQQSVFEPFVRLDHPHGATPDDALRGNGLGLSVVERLIQGWGGSIQLVSTPNEGTCFDVWLPIEAIDTSHPVAQTSSGHLAHTVFNDALKILIVDDHALNRQVAAATIHQQMPHVVIDEAKNGKEALGKMSTVRYDIVFMDLVMPDMMGTEVVRRIRIEGPEPYQQVRVVALTADLSETAQKDCQAAGITEILPKPLNREALIHTIRHKPL